MEASVTLVSSKLVPLALKYYSISNMKFSSSLAWQFPLKALGSRILNLLETLHVWFRVWLPTACIIKFTCTFISAILTLIVSIVARKLSDRSLDFLAWSSEKSRALRHALPCAWENSKSYSHVQNYPLRQFYVLSNQPSTSIRLWVVRLPKHSMHLLLQLFRPTHPTKSEEILFSSSNSLKYKNCSSISLSRSDCNFDSCLIAARLAKELTKLLYHFSQSQFSNTEWTIVRHLI